MHEKIGMAVLALSALATPVHAQTLTPALRACERMTDSTKRLSCYDAEMRRIEASARSGAPSASTQAPAAEPPPSSRISAQVTAVSRQGSGRYLVSLDNGQVWLQTQDDLGFDPQAGDPVTIKRGALGSYWMTSKHSVVSVRRLH